VRESPKRGVDCEGRSIGYLRSVRGLKIVKDGRNWRSSFTLVVVPCSLGSGEITALGFHHPCPALHFSGCAASRFLSEVDKCGRLLGLTTVGGHAGL
jgi:hypothetical protein